MFLSQKRDGEKQRLHAKEDRKAGRCFADIQHRHPADLRQDSSGRRQDEEVIPFLPEDDGRNAGVQQGDIAEEQKSIVGSFGEQWRREEASQQPENNHHLRVEPDREEEGGDRDNRHQSKRRRQRNEIVKGVRAKDGGVEDEDAGRTQALTGDAIVPACGEPTGADEGATDHGANHDSHQRRNEVVFERILHEEDDAEEEDEAADPGEEFDAEERFPIDGSARCRGRSRWCFRRRRDGGGGCRLLKNGSEGSRNRSGDRWCRCHRGRRRSCRRLHWHCDLGFGSAKLSLEHCGACIQFLQRRMQSLDLTRVRDAKNQRQHEEDERKKQGTGEDRFHQSWEGYYRRGQALAAERSPETERAAFIFRVKFKDQ